MAFKIANIISRKNNKCFFITFLPIFPIFQCFKLKKFIQQVGVGKLNLNKTFHKKFIKNKKNVNNSLHCKNFLINFFNLIDKNLKRKVIF
ncbi:hypothetical protein D9V87_06915 [Bacteroidetes/Chlorobi group bacterium MS-B_bin-24]|nr:MAG: hypothetical protein D9V87_06915 [Bacteroidetes/Chlorobi group bacterium MS-B_bin-24]